MVVFWLSLLVCANLFLALWSSAPPSAASGEPARNFPREITLLNELGPDELSEMAAPLRAPPLPARDEHEAVGLAPPALVCRVWGPIGEPGVLEDLRARIAAAGDVVDVRESAVASDPDYLVYIDTDQNLDNARRLLKELGTQKIDAYVISGGELQNSVSVGVFSVESRALVQQQRLSELGYRPVVEPLNRAQTVYHLYGRVPEGFETAGHSSADCATIASIQ